MLLSIPTLTFWCLMRLAILSAFLLVVSVSRADEFKPDAGFTALFNGKDLAGWKLTKGGDSLDGKTDAYAKRFFVKDGSIIIDPKVKGDLHIETQKVMPKNVHIKFEFKPDEKCNNDLFLHGMKYDLSTANLKELKKDEWQTMELIAKDGKCEYKHNGKSVKSMNTKGEPSSFRIRAEFGAIEIRKLQMAEVK